MTKFDYKVYLSHSKTISGFLLLYDLVQVATLYLQDDDNPGIQFVCSIAIAIVPSSNNQRMTPMMVTTLSFITNYLYASEKDILLAAEDCVAFWYVSHKMSAIYKVLPKINNIKTNNFSTISHDKLKSKLLVITESCFLDIKLNSLIFLPCH